MDKQIFLFALVLSIHHATSMWSCSTDSDCSNLRGSICNDGICECSPGSQSVLGGTVCADVAPYHTSPCFEDYQCVRLFSGYHCRKSENETVGSCMCLPGHHYYRGRCWRSIDFGETCSRSEECMGLIRDPFSLTCNSTCQCSEGYYERQRGECRRAALSVNESCVVNDDCRFPGGACNVTSFSCIENTADTNFKFVEESTSVQEPSIKIGEETEKHRAASSNVTVQRVVCNSTVSCPSPLECSILGVCTCPLGYYQSSDENICLAELGSPSTTEQCVGFLAEVFDGICACRPHSFYEENMRDCVRVTRRLEESCVSDGNCHTFGAAARCGPPQDPWGFRSCECIPELTVWDMQRNLCRYFAGIGETCEVDSDCLAGELEIQCVKNDAGQGYCTCPDGLQEFEGLCLTSGLGLGDSCQHSLECTGTANTVCDGVCTCRDGYQDVGGSCAPAIGGACSRDSDCVIENTVCRNSSRGFTCQCDVDFVESNSVCWPSVSGFNSTCSVNAQCVAALGSSSSCVEGVCACAENNHYRDGGCWAVTGIFQPCSRTSQCYLAEDSSRVVCRNSICQCDFDYPYSEETRTCLYSSASHITIYTALLIFPALSIILR